MSKLYSIEIELEEKVEFRTRLNGDINTFEVFKKVIQDKLERVCTSQNVDPPEIESIHYTLTNTSGYYEIFDDEEVTDFNKEAHVLRLMINRKAEKKQEEDNKNKTLDKSYQNAMAKLTISNFPYQFNGDSNLSHFKVKVTNYCKINKIGSGVLLKLILNGKIITDAAFQYLQTKIHILYCSALSVDAQLAAIWQYLQRKYGKTNQVINYKQRLQHIKQNKLTIKEYLDVFHQNRDELDLEIELQKECGFAYKAFTEYELTEIFMKGLKAEFQSSIINKMMHEYNSTNIKMEELETILIKEIEKEKYLNLIQNRKVTQVNEGIFNINKGNQANYNETNCENDQIYALQQQVHQLQSKLGRDNRSNRKCRHGFKCRYGMDCKFQHTEKEINYFRRNNIANRSGRGNQGRNNRYNNANNAYQQANKNGYGAANGNDQRQHDVYAVNEMKQEYNQQSVNEANQHF